MGFRDMSPSDIANQIGLVSLATRQKYSDVVIAYKLINGVIDCPEFLSKIGFRVLSLDSRNKSSFHVLINSRN